MNKRLKELKQQAMRTQVNYPEGWEEICENELEKFAELIVLECIDVFSKDLPDPTSADYKLGTLQEVTDRICKVVEHFAVE